MPYDTRVFGYRPRQYGTAPRSSSISRYLSASSAVGPSTSARLAGGTGLLAPDKGGYSAFNANPTGGSQAPAKPSQPAPTQPAPVQPGAGGQQQAQQPAQLAYDYDADPVLQKIKAMSGLQRSQANAEALASRKQVAIDFGDDTYARDVLHDENTAKAAADNPFSVRRQLRTGYDELVRGLEENLNQRNLFYSGHRGQRLGEEANAYQGRLYDAGREQQGLLEGIRRGLLDALMNADRQDAEALEDAAGRAMERGEGPPSPGDPTADPNMGGAVSSGIIHAAPLTDAQKRRQERLLAGLGL